jgi:hypothetical protein
MQVFKVIVLFILFQCVQLNGALAAQKAKVTSPKVDVYSAADFDSEVLGSVDEGETFYISDKVYGPFFRIKLKSGKIGYIPDTEVYIEGKGRAVPGAGDVDEDPFLQQIDLGEDPDASQKKDKNSKSNLQRDDEEYDENERSGVTIQLINYHEDTLGAVQIDDLTAIGYKSISDLSWEVLVSFQAPKYYSKLLDATAKGANIWGDFGVSNEVPFFKRFSACYSGGFFGHLSIL